MNYSVQSLTETQKIATNLAQQLKDGGIVGLVGPLGAGKTTFAQAFAKSLGIEDSVISPTFILHRVYQIPGRKDGQFHHLDLYRLEKAQDISQLGLSEIIGNPSNIVLIEWAEKLPDLPENTTMVTISRSSEDQREIKVETFAQKHSH